jgi:ATP-dependent helicase/nuclease subunit A
LSRIAAITFTRKAAGELQLRLRQALLERLDAAAADDARRSLLATALGEVDISFIGTIHSFADRLLRMRPVEAGISPSYEILDQEDSVLAEATELLLTSSESGVLPEALFQVMTSVGLRRAQVEEAQKTIQDYIAAGLPVETKSYGFQSNPGFDALVRGMVLQRDVPFPCPEISEPLIENAKKSIQAFLGRIEALPGDSHGTKWLRRLAQRLNECLDEPSTIELFASLRRNLVFIPKFTKRDHFGDDNEGWSLWKEFDKGDDKKGFKPIKNVLLAPLCDWLGRRLARIASVVVAAYEQVKANYELVDQTDLLIKLRDMLQKNEGNIRAFYQGLFDHLLVDEFQDTDPLQAEILFFLAEAGQSAVCWNDVNLTPGQITILGDPKQSIYRFRRADIVTYAKVCEHMANQQALVRRIETNFRSRPALIHYFNDRLEELLGKAPADGKSFDSEHGMAFYEKLLAGPIEEMLPILHVLPYSDPESQKLYAARARDIEAEMLARYLCWLKNKSGLRIRDRETETERPVEYGDVAILAHTTTNLPKLFRAFERYGIPYAARGATLFLKEPVIQQFILGLRAVADDSDGIAQAAFFRPPFLALDLADVVAGRLKDQEYPPAVAEAATRAQNAHEILSKLRKSRFEGSPSHTARRLMEDTAFAKTLSLMPNGNQKLAAAREVLFILDELVAREGLDFDGATARLREWVDSPVQMDPPAPVSGQVVLVLTIHQAKGLEFPIVILWDGFATFRGRPDAMIWRVTRDGDWALELEGFKASSLKDNSLIEHEKSIAKEERKRLYYVAATRARDLLVIPMPPKEGTEKVSHILVGDVDSEAVLKMDEFQLSALPEWAKNVEQAPPFPELKIDDEKAEKELKDRWQSTFAVSSKPIAVPIAVTYLTRAKEVTVEEAASSNLDTDLLEVTTDMSGEKSSRQMASRFGSGFGATVHKAITTILRGSHAEIADIVKVCAAENKLADHLDEAIKDVQTTLASLNKIGIIDKDVALYPDYPVVKSDGQGRLIIGYIDLVAYAPECVWIIDFKTDTPPAESLEITYPAYKKQIEFYEDILINTVRIDQPIKAKLLFTANGSFVG